MRTMLVFCLCFQLLCGCTPGKDHAVPPATMPMSPNAAAPTAQAGLPTQAPKADQPSYEVSIASAQADRVHALEVCDDRRTLDRTTCIREADAAYDAARDAAETIREAGR